MRAKYRALITHQNILHHSEQNKMLWLQRIDAAQTAKIFFVYGLNWTFLFCW